MDASVDPETDAPVATEAPPLEPTCRRCGYDLRGVSLDAACPECGVSVEASARLGVPLFATTAGFKRFRWGIRLLGLGFVLILLPLGGMSVRRLLAAAGVFVVGVALMASTRLHALASRAERTPQVVLVVMLGLSLACITGLQVIGWRGLARTAWQILTVVFVAAALASLLWWWRVLARRCGSSLASATAAIIAVAVAAACLTAHGVHAMLTAPAAPDARGSLHTILSYGTGLTVLASGVLTFAAVMRVDLMLRRHRERLCPSERA